MGDSNSAEIGTQPIVLLPDDLLVDDTHAKNEFGESELSDIPFYSVYEFVNNLSHHDGLLTEYQAITSTDTNLQNIGNGYGGITFRMAVGASDLVLKIDFNTPNALRTIGKLIRHCPSITAERKNAINNHIYDNYSILHRMRQTIDGTSRVIGEIKALTIAGRIDELFVPKVVGVLTSDHSPAGIIMDFVPGETTRQSFIKLSTDWADQSMFQRYSEFLANAKNAGIVFDEHTDAFNAIVQRNAEGKITSAKLIDLDLKEQFGYYTTKQY